MPKLLFLSLFWAFGSFAKAGPHPVKCSKKEVKNAIEFFTKKDIKLATKIPATALKPYSFLSGKHVVKPRINESMHAFWLETDDMTTFFKFTVSPALSTREFKAASKQDFLLLLEERKITQYRIIELNDKVHRDLAISANGKVQKKP